MRTFVHASRSSCQKHTSMFFFLFNFLSSIQVKVQEDPVPAAALAPTTVTLDTVEIEDVELNVTKNRSAHHTERYDYDGLIVRRGQPFNLTLVTKKPLPSGKTSAGYINRYM